MGRHDNALKRECDANAVVVGSAKTGLGFHPSSAACLSTIDATLLLPCQTSVSAWVLLYRHPPSASLTSYATRSSVPLPLMLPAVNCTTPPCRRSFLHGGLQAGLTSTRARCASTPATTSHRCRLHLHAPWRPPSPTAKPPCSVLHRQPPRLLSLPVLRQCHLTPTARTGRQSALAEDLIRRRPP
ncbi:Os07g0235625 [Oryza sativa Japonica Group]|uniref:Os07g0235625 protein n=2 Tax=Oryza sativa subsp. japonica TaxID=39947 RepID=Q8H447_ORYSJ|nr:hypothetical protein [Oryza sativa Japonica Group]BAT00739.1 Os07g0235625 [Oryza sativa Japonica Group]